MCTAFTQKQVWTLSPTLGATFECIHSEHSNVRKILLVHFISHVSQFRLLLCMQSVHQQIHICLLCAQRHTCCICTLKYFEFEIYNYSLKIITIKSIRNIHAHISFVCSNNVCASMYFLVLDFSRSIKIKYLHFERYHQAWLQDMN